MWNQTAAAERLGITYPILQGPFGGGLSSTVLSATVSNAGGLGCFGAESVAPEMMEELVSELRLLTARPFAVNLWIPRDDVPPPSAADWTRHVERLEPFLAELGLPRPEQPDRFGESYHDQVQALLDARPPVFSFVYGVPAPRIMAQCRARGVVTLGTATTPDEAAALEHAGVDCIVASGAEAGGHKGAFLKPPQDGLLGTFALVPRTVDRVKVPVIAAGGVADARGVRAALALGAQGVQIGTAFLACEESGASPAYRERLLNPEQDETVLTNAFTGRLARSLPNRLSEAMGPDAANLPPYPIQSWLTGRLKPLTIAGRRTDLVSLWAGQAAPLVRHRTAEALFEELVQGMADR